MFKEEVAKMNKKLVIVCLTLAATQYFVGTMIYHFSSFTIGSFGFTAVSYLALAGIYLTFLIYQAFKLGFSDFGKLAFTATMSIFLGHIASFGLTGDLMSLSNYLFDYVFVLGISLIVLWLYNVLRKT